MAGWSDGSMNGFLEVTNDKNNRSISVATTFCCKRKQLTLAMMTICPWNVTTSQEQQQQQKTLQL